MDLALLLSVQAAGSALYYLSTPVFFVFGLAAYASLSGKWEAARPLYLAWFGWLMWHTYVPSALLPPELVAVFGLAQSALGIYLVRHEQPALASGSDRGKAWALAALLLALLPFNYVTHPGSRPLAMLELAGQSAAYTAFATTLQRQQQDRPLVVVACSIWVLAAYWMVAVPLAVVVAMAGKRQRPPPEERPEPQPAVSWKEVITKAVEPDDVERGVPKLNGGLLREAKS